MHAIWGTSAIVHDVIMESESLIGEEIDSLLDL